MTIYDVVIVGGGISGLYTARRLAESTSLSIAVLEASSRFGGRFRTCTMPGNFPADFGAMRFVPSAHVIFNKLIQDLGVPTEKLFSEDDLNNERPKDYFRNCHVKGLDEMRKLYSIRDKDMPYFLDARQPFKLKFPPGSDDFWEAEVEGTGQLAKDMTITQYHSLSMNSKVMNRDNALLVPLNWSVALLAVRDHKFVQNRTKNSRYWCVTNGMETVITALVSELEKLPNVTLIKNAWVDRVDEGDFFTVGVNESGSTDPIQAKKLVLACNSRGMELISWNSPKNRTTRLQQLLSNIHRMHAIKLFLTYESGSWKNELDCSATVLTDLPLSEIFMFGQRGQQDGYVTILATFTYRNVDIFEGLNQLHYPRFVNKCGDVPEDLQPSQLLVDYVQKQLKAVFDKEKMPEPVCASCKIWNADPLGVASHRPKVAVDMFKLQFEAMKPFQDADVYIIGDTFAANTKTAIFNGWSEGALLSCERMLHDYFQLDLAIPELDIPRRPC